MRGHALAAWTLSTLLLGAGCSVLVSTTSLSGGAPADSGAPDEGAVERDGGRADPDADVGLLGRWDFESLQDGIVVDSSGRAAAGMVRGDPKPVPGRVGATALSFDGEDDFIELGSHATLQPSGAFTVSAWVNPADFADEWGGAGFLVADGPDCCSATSGTGLGLHLMGGQKPRGYIWRSRSEQVDVTGVDLSVGSWHSIVFTFDGVVLKVYQDGTLTKSNAVGPTRVDRKESVPLLIGRVRISGGAAYPFHGAIDDVRLYDRALGPAEVSSIFAGTN